jgi:hypothetical protein
MTAYIDGYIKACEETIEKYDSPKWFAAFFVDYLEQIRELSVDKSDGNRTFLTKAFGNAFNHLIPESGFVVATGNERFSREVSFKDFIDINVDNEFHNFLGRKRVDFVLKNASGKILLIEFKNTASFDSISSAATEMKLLRDFCKKELKPKITTWSISMFCGQSPDSLNLLSQHLGDSIDQIWSFRKWDSGRGFETPFDPKQFIVLRTALIAFSKT